jgi:hypothetical protein
LEFKAIVSLRKQMHPQLLPNIVELFAEFCHFVINRHYAYRKQQQPRHDGGGQQQQWTADH